MLRKSALYITILLSLGFPASSLASGGISPTAPPPDFKKASIKNGLAVPAPGTPARVVRALKAGNRIAKKPYRWSGGHDLWRGSLKNYIKSQGGFDCSGSVSFLLGSFGGDWLKRPFSSGAFLSWGKRGKGRWFTVYTSRNHAYLVIAGLRFDTSGLDERGTRWSKDGRGILGLVPRRLR